jgi:hypothetical protein
LAAVRLGYVWVVGYIGAGGGLYYKSVGVSVQYTTNLQKNGLEVGVFKMF